MRYNPPLGTTAMAVARDGNSAPSYCPLVLLTSALAAGIVCDRYELRSPAVWWLSAATLLAAWLALWRWRRERLASSLLLASAMALGGVWHHTYWRLYRADEIGRLVREDARPACVEAVAITSPRWVPAPPPTPLRTIPQGEKSE